MLVYAGIPMLATANNPDYLLLNALPFYEDVRSFAFPSFETPERWVPVLEKPAWSYLASCERLLLVERRVRQVCGTCDMRSHSTHLHHAHSNAHAAALHVPPVSHASILLFFVLLPTPAACAMTSSRGHQIPKSWHQIPASYLIPMQDPQRRAGGRSKAACGCHVAGRG